MSKRRPPKHLFRRPRLPAAIVAGIAELADGNPEMHSMLTSAMTALADETFLTAFALVPAHTRASMLLAWQHAVAELRSAKPCDFCPEAKAAAVRFLSIARAELVQSVPLKPRVGQEAGEESCVGFSLVCSRCARLTAAELGRRLVKDHAAMIQAAANTPFRRPTIIGFRIGEPGSLPRRHGLEECEECQQTLGRVRAEANPDLRLIGYLITMFNFTQTAILSRNTPLPRQPVRPHRGATGRSRFELA
jgi:hypothetical protein